MKTQKPMQLNSTFWSDFAKNIWERKPLVLRDVQSSLLEINEDEIFALLVSYADRCRKAKNSEGFKFFVEGIRAHDYDVLQVLPVKNDKSLRGYHARMNVLFTDYCLVCDELLQVNLEKQARLKQFTDELYRHVGFPNRFAEMGLYLGNYQRTPFGVHVDSCGVFSLPVTGTKTFRLWTTEFVKKNPTLDRAFDYAKFKKNSKVMTAKPGDMVYWPSSAYHIAESDGEFSATWSLGIWLDQTHQQQVSEALQTLLNEKIGDLCFAPTMPFKKLHRKDGQVDQLPDQYLQTIKALQSLTSRQLKTAFLKTWMRHISTQGFKVLPVRPAKLSARSTIWLSQATSPVLWFESKDEDGEKSKTYLSFGGQLIETKRSRELLKMIKDLNAQKGCLVGAYLNRPGSRGALASLQALAEAGAFRLSSPK
ncbi:MAG: JmjC domain-containing protein [Bdellovibrio sp.]|jgi:hypothetical protein